MKILGSVCILVLVESLHAAYNVSTETPHTITTHLPYNFTTEPASNHSTEPSSYNTTEPTTLIPTTEPSFDTTTEPSHSSTAQPDDGPAYPKYLGFICAGIAVVFYGSNFVPVKKFETGDGMFFQWVFCSGIFTLGMILQIWRKSTFYPLVMIGGLVWGTGNICVVPIIKTVGMGLGMCIWGMTNLFAGWASGRFGWFGLTAEVPDKVVLNYIGVALAVSSSIIYVFVKNETNQPNVEMTIQVEDERSPLVQESRGSLYGGNPQEDVLVFNKGRRSSSLNSNLTDSKSRDHSFVDDLSPGNKRIVGIVLSMGSGVCYGLNFTPAIYIQDRHNDASSPYHGCSKNPLDYVFAEFCGIFLTSTFYFLIYCIAKKNQPVLYPKVILPAIISGLMWGVATACWFISNQTLSEPVAFPIITTGPGAVASLFWGVCVFREIKGARNIAILLLAFVVTIAGVVLAAISKS